MAAASQAQSTALATGGSIGTDSNGVNWTLIVIAALVAAAVLWWFSRGRKKR